MKKSEKLIVKICIISYILLIVGAFVYSFFDEDYYISLDNVTKVETKLGYTVIDKWESEVTGIDDYAREGYHVSFKHKNGELYKAPISKKELDLYEIGDKIEVTTYVHTTKKGYILNIEHRVKFIERKQHNEMPEEVTNE